MQLPLEEKRNRVLLTAYEIHTTKTRHINIEELGRLSGVGREVWQIVMQLGSGPTGKGWFKKSGGIVRFTADGEEKVEELLKMQMAGLERLILQKFYDLGGPTHMGWVVLTTLAKELDMKFSAIRPVINDLEERRLIAGADEAMGLTPEGVREVENPSSQRKGVSYFETHIHNSQGFAVGENIKQDITINNDFRTAIAKLLTGVEASQSLSVVEKINLTQEVRSIEQLGQLEKTPEVIEAANTKIDAVTSVLSTTADLVSLGMVVIPILKAWFGG